MTDHHNSDHLPSGDAAAPEGDSFSDEAGQTVPPAGVDHPRPVDSDVKRVRTDVPERLDALLPGEAALVYQHLRGRLATMFDDDGN
ncbi:MAG: hypothetical protein JSR79_00510 [Proteobacteria bacterium]|nr:hypothetical protein [Pseudomonadota bacterium]